MIHQIDCGNRGSRAVSCISQRLGVRFLFVCVCVCVCVMPFSFLEEMSEYRTGVSIKRG